MACSNLTFLTPDRWSKSLLLALLFAAKSYSATVEGQVRDQTGRPVGNAVVVATPIQGILPDSQYAPRAEVLDQRNREFIPHVLVVRAGTEVSFPNHDKIRHHVYSFSAAKRFEIKLYKDAPPNPIRFDTPGIAVLGCNIHDWMISYVYVTDSPYFTKTDASGRWSLQVPVNDYKFSIWHPDMSQGELYMSETQALAEHQAIFLDREINLKNKIRTGKPPASLLEEGYKDEP